MKTYKNAAKDVSINDCLLCQSCGLAVIVNDAKDVTFEMEED